MSEKRGQVTWQHIFHKYSVVMRLTSVSLDKKSIFGAEKEPQYFIFLVCLFQNRNMLV